MKCITCEVDVSGGSKGGARAIHPPGCPHSFNFMQFLGKFGKILCWHPSGGLVPPPRGNPRSTPGCDCAWIDLCGCSGHLGIYSAQRFPEQ